MQLEKERERRMLIRQDRSEAITALRRAAQAGDLAEVKQWLELAPSLINDTDFGRTPLGWAVNAPHPETFLYLLSKDTTTRYRYHDCHTLAERIALYCSWPSAAKETALQALAEKGVVLNPFLLAACRGDTEALSEEALLVRDSQRNNVAHYASASGQVLLLQQLHTIQPQLFTRDAPHFPSFQDRPSLFMWAAMNGYLTAVQWSLREGGARITERYYGNTALLWAAERGRLEVVQWLLREGGAQIIEHNDYDKTALLLAARSTHEDIVNLLIGEFGADPGDGMAIAKLLGASSNFGAVDSQKLIYGIVNR
jgi:ankyrin repeat protein